MLPIFLLGFGIAISLLYGASFLWAHPLIVFWLACLGLAAIILNWRKMVTVTIPVRREHGEREYRMIPWFQALIKSVMVGILVYILLSFVFVAVFGSLTAVGPWTILGNASAMGTEATKVALAVVVAFCIFWLWFTKKTDSRWLFWMVSVVAVVSLMGMSTVGYFTSKFPEDGVRRAHASLLARENVVRWFEANVFTSSWRMGNKANRIAALGVANYDRLTIPQTVPWGLQVYSVTFRMLQQKYDAKAEWIGYPEVQLADLTGKVYTQVRRTDAPDEAWYIPQSDTGLPKKDQPVYLAVPTLGEPEKPETGSQWIVHWPIHFVGGNSGMKYIQLVRRDDENVVRYAKQDYLDEILNQKPVLVDPKIAIVTTPETEVVTVAMTTGPPIMVGEERAVDEDYVNINGEEWTDTEIIPEDGDRIMIFGSDGKPMLTEDLKKVQLRIGMLGLGEVGLEYCSDGQHAIGFTIVDGKNTRRLTADGVVKRLHLRCKKSEPGEMTVIIRRSKGY